MKEYELQKRIVTWFRERYPNYIIFSVPNEATYNKGNRFKSSGMLKGAPDLILVLPEKVIFLELKVETNIQSGDQRLFEIKAQQLKQQYYVIRDLEDFKKILRNNLYCENWIDL